MWTPASRGADYTPLLQMFYRIQKLRSSLDFLLLLILGVIRTLSGLGVLALVLDTSNASLPNFSTLQACILLLIGFGQKT